MARSRSKSTSRRNVEGVTVTRRRVRGGELVRQPRRARGIGRGVGQRLGAEQRLQRRERMALY